MPNVNIRVEKSKFPLLLNNRKINFAELNKLFESNLQRNREFYDNSVWDNFYKTLEHQKTQLFIMYGLTAFTFFINLVLILRRETCCASSCRKRKTKITKVKTESEEEEKSESEEEKKSKPTKMLRKSRKTKITKVETESEEEEKSKPTQMLCKLRKTKTNNPLPDVKLTGINNQEISYRIDPATFPFQIK